MAQLELRRTVARMQLALDEGGRTPAAGARTPQATGDRARELLAESNEMRSRIRDLLGGIDEKKTR